MRWHDKLANADLRMTNYARGKKEKASLVIHYYGRKDGVRKVIECHEIETDEFIDTKVEED